MRKEDPRARRLTTKTVGLDAFPIGRTARIVRINSLREQVERMVEMGFVRGAEVLVVRAAPLGGPILVEIGCCRLALHRCDARCIEVEDASTRMNDDRMSGDDPNGTGTFVTKVGPFEQSAAGSPVTPFQP